MSDSAYSSVAAFAPMLQMLSDILDKGAAHVAAKGENADTLVGKALAPDMFPLGFQIAFACHQVTSATALLQGHAAAEFANPETGFADLKATLAKTLAHVNGLSAAAFAGADARTVVVPLQGPMQFQSGGAEFMRDWLMPTFYFHVVTAYDILRHEGVEIGKRDFIGNSAGRYIGPRA